MPIRVFPVVPTSRSVDKSEDAVDWPKVLWSSFNLWAAGITIVIGGQYFSWNAGLTAGTLSFGIATLMMAFAYTSMGFCAAEIASMVPFEGGAFGLARCTWGFYAGFIVGCCEAIQYIVYVTCSFVFFGKMLGALWPFAADHPHFIWFLAYALSSITLMLGGTVYWRWNMALALISIGFVFIYVFGSLPYVDIVEFGGGHDQLFVGGFSQFMLVFPLTAWWYVGVESINRLVSDAYEPRLSVPIAQISCVLTLFCTAIMVLMVAISIDPGMPEVAGALSPLNYGFNRMFRCSDDVSGWFSIPATFATGQGFVQSYSKVITCMAGSGLLPSKLYEMNATFKSPIYAILFGSTASFLLCFVDYFYSLDAMLFNTCMILGSISYTSQCVGYIYLKKNFRTMERKFHSPLGKSGAVYSITVWVINAIAIIGFQGDDQKSFLTFILILVVCTVFYHLYAKHHQKFSEEERMSLFFAHVANHNNLKRSNRSNRSRKKFTLKVLELAKKLSEKKKLLSPTRQVLFKETSITQQPQDGSKFKSSNASKIVSIGPPRV
ncbi:unnamed protein product [Aphanomyces euteiches]|uniref:Amino acid permease/ SLC12A domain-containing protein n=1 Tax=Aphanomyces euteiches TaxID=100861 RepID=A0A6G0XRD6_9STRA|nr:hypothetical protein Ae201684_002060 [Aphanomyces euteiches]KAH9086964.1 hypothetical protein Ae201684P_000379 [Aphanomyces euteiches]KAH9157005.1 hypothetical protein AeRB84_001108 [Aphanomyces euteiches]